MCFQTAVGDCATQQQAFAKRPIEALNVAGLPRRTGLDEPGVDIEIGQVLANGLVEDLRPVVAATRRALLPRQSTG